MNAIALLRASPRLRPAPALLRARTVRSLIRQAAPYSLLNVITAVAFYSDTLIVARVLGPAAAAEYAVPARLAAVLTGLLTFLAFPLWPAYVDGARRGDWVHVAQMYHACLRRSIWAGLLAAGTLLLSGTFVIKVWVGDSVPVSFPALAGQSAWVLLFVVGNAVNVLLNSQGELRVLIRLYSVMMVANIGLSLILVRAIGVSGPILATDATFLVMTLLPLLLRVRQLLASWQRQTPAGPA